MFDYNLDFPDSVVRERKVPIKWESVYSLDYWLYHRPAKQAGQEAA